MYCTGKTKETATAGRGNESGLTLLEVAIALVFITIAALAAAGTVIASNRSGLHAQNWTSAYRSAQQALETLISQDMATMAAQDGNQFQVLSTQPNCIGNISVTDLQWEGTNGSTYQLVITVPEFNVRLTAVRTSY